MITRRCATQAGVSTAFAQDYEGKPCVLNEKSDAPMMFVEEITELQSFEDLNLPGTGFSFYAHDATQ